MFFDLDEPRRESMHYYAKNPNSFHSTTFTANTDPRSKVKDHLYPGTRSRGMIIQIMDFQGYVRFRAGVTVHRAIYRKLNSRIHLPKPLY